MGGGGRMWRLPLRIQQKDELCFPAPSVSLEAHLARWGRRGGRGSHVVWVFLSAGTGKEAAGLTPPFLQLAGLNSSVCSLPLN